MRANAQVEKTNLMKGQFALIIVATQMNGTMEYGATLIPRPVQTHKDIQVHWYLGLVQVVSLAN